MKLREIFRFELVYQLRRFSTWLCFGIPFVFAFSVMAGSRPADEAALQNSPFGIAFTTVFSLVIWLLVGASLAGEMAARDVQTRMDPLMYTAPISKLEYLGGRFLAAFTLNALILLGVQAGILLGVYAPGVPPEIIGPFRPAAYLTAYAYIALPTTFVATALQFGLARRTGRGMAGYAGSVILIFMGYFVATSVYWFVRPSLGMLLDPIGINLFVEDMSRSWTILEQNQRLIGLEGTVLRNRLLWLGVGMATLVFTYLRFRFAHLAESSPFGSLRSWWRRKRGLGDAHAPTPAAIGVIARAPVSVPQVSRTFGFANDALQTLAMAWTSFRAIATGWAGLFVLVIIPMLSVLIVLDQMVSLGTPLVPTTARVLGELTAPLSAPLNRWLIVPLVIAFFAGELVWRERDAGLGEITGALPGSDWALFLGKLLGLGLLLAVFLAMLMAAGLLAQTILGYQHFEIGLYLKILFGLQLPDYLPFAVLALVLHVLVDQKYIGHLVAVMAYMFIAVLAPMLGLEQSLFVYGAGPGWSYTSMRGFGASLGPWAWFKLYWVGWALLLAVVGRLLWVRGMERALHMRTRLAYQRLTPTTAVTRPLAAGLILASGGLIFYNTNVLNEYQSISAVKEQQAEYERLYGQYENIPQPELTGTNLRLEIYPEQRMVEIRGSYHLVNGSAEPIDSIHVTTSTDEVETRAITFDRTATLAVDDDEHGYRIYALVSPLQPGEALRLDFEVHVERRGFGYCGADPLVQPNGSYFTNAEWFPVVGYQRFRQLLSVADRRTYGLPPRPLLVSLEDADTGALTTRGGITFEAVLGTDADQVAVAPGALRPTWSEGNRRYFQYVADAPIGSEWAFFSADYAVEEVKWQGVTIRIFHHPSHAANLDRLVQSIRASLVHYTREIAPYPYGHLTVVENPGAPGEGMHADPSLISYGQGFQDWTPKKDGKSLDLPFAIVAHEMAHQWTVPIAFVEGAPVMSESLAWYYGMQVVRESYGEAELRRLLHFMRQPFPYPPIRRGEPLLRSVEPYMSYRKGPFALFALSEYIGTEQVNTALRRLYEKHHSGEPPLATTLDLYRELRAVTLDSHQYLLHDLFEVNTYWEFATERVTAEQIDDGNWQVTLDLRAHKVVSDESGEETEMPLDELVQIGVFGPGAESDKLGAPFYLQMHRIRSGRQTITVIVPHKPILAGIDPYHLLDWVEGEEDDDNIYEVAVES